MYCSTWGQRSTDASFMRKGCKKYLKMSDFNKLWLSGRLIHRTNCYCPVNVDQKDEEVKNWTEVGVYRNITERKCWWNTDVKVQTTNNICLLYTEHHHLESK